ncbi:GFA family protein [Rhizobium sp. 32-5/1]|uniref:GFA family protein n=1 Tax=Rhizobium sp. 32-5/1 TaxID=3019602 RepID=UPI00240E61A6|nr:GFA family protein [Rhizobium sp. 32-5/1]WEZ83212.1 GFA family protein [Rhizobium sp. 32-5/1]
MITLSGSCLCKAVRFQISGPIMKTGHCHCESCRRATSSPVTTFLSSAIKHVAFTGAPRRIFASSPGVSRGFCGACGSPLSFETEARPGEIDLYVASLEGAAGVPIEQHWYWNERVDWLTCQDDLPKHDD